MDSLNFDRASFDGMASTYDEVRPGYGRELYDFIDSTKPFSERSLILEVGSGSGIATEEIADRWNPGIVALEPGKNLRAAARKRLGGRGKIELVASTFEDYDGGGRRFDAIFSATAFHWVDPAVKYRKAFELLSDDGFLVLYWNNFGIADDGVAKAMDALYREYGMSQDGGTARERQAGNIARRRKEIDESGFFAVARSGLFRNRFTYTTQRYLGLLGTFSDHSKAKIPDIESFYADVTRLLDTGGGSIEVEIAVSLEMARKVSSGRAGHLRDLDD
jgi:SAM-dependent methyltransferase